MKRPSLRCLLLIGALLPMCVPAAEPMPAIPFTMGATSRQASFPGTDGRRIYERICQGCHMGDGTGALQGPSTYPPVAANPKLAARAYPALIIVNGLGAMPAFGTLLNDEQVAAVVNYVRGNFANQYADALSAAEVAALRPATQAAATELRGR